MTDTTKLETRCPRRMAREPRPEPAIAAIPTEAPPSAKAPTKATQVEALLLQDAGASLEDLCQATGWLPHTCRAFLSGLRKKGRGVEKGKREDGVTVYRMVELEAAA